MFGRHRRLVLRSEWLTLLPETGCRPQRSHRVANLVSPFMLDDVSAMMEQIQTMLAYAGIFRKETDPSLACSAWPRSCPDWDGSRTTADGW